MYETKPYFYGTGRRKDSVARVRVYTGTGKITINDRDIDNYFGLETLKLIVRSPLVLLGLEGKYDVVVRVSGGGVSGQAGAIRHGSSRKIVGLRTGGRRAKSLKNRVKSSKIELRFREVRSEGCTSCTSVLQALIYFRCIFTALLRQSRFCLLRSCAQKEHPRAFEPGVFCCDRECQVEAESIFCSWVLAR